MSNHTKANSVGTHGFIHARYTVDDSRMIATVQIINRLGEFVSEAVRLWIHLPISLLCDFTLLYFCSLHVNYINESNDQTNM